MFATTAFDTTVANSIGSPTDLCQRLADDDYVVIDGHDLIDFISQEPGIDRLAIDTFTASWNDLAPDGFMADGGKYRSRRHATMRGDRAGGPIALQPHQAHFQTIDYNPLNGGIERQYEPIDIATINSPVMAALLRFAASIFGGLAPFNSWHVEVHQFRIAAIEGGGKPTPEGIHRDGVSYVMMTLLRRSHVAGGVTSIYKPDGEKLTEFMLLNPFDTALVNDERVKHGVTPVVKEVHDAPGYRDMLVITFRRQPVPVAIVAGAVSGGEA